ncbi:MAG: sugar phosphate isomerase/epimerase [Verrucomicrobiaceae bacterium]|nr:sugar phosphate isomerase/epimerase [Verrucomicrobiaceae bacterium]
MILSVSNIAWPVADDPAAYEMLGEEGIRQLEIAPPRFWPNLATVEEGDARRHADEITQRALLICSFQALLFGRPDLQVIGDQGGRECID